jgi:hypothetical protein
MMKIENRIVLDYAMLLALFLLMVKLMTGAMVHEALGVGFAALAAAHLRGGKSRVKTMWKKKGLFLLNALLLLSLLSTAMSGVALSVALFRWLNLPYHAIFYTVHTLSAYALLLLSLAHLALHMKTVAAYFRKRKQARPEKTREA